MIFALLSSTFILPIPAIKQPSVVQCMCFYIFDTPPLRRPLKLLFQQPKADKTSIAFNNIS